MDIPDNKDKINTVDVEGYSEAISEKPRMFSEVEIKGVALMPQVDNSDETLRNQDKFHDAGEETQFKVYESSQENRLENLDIIKNTLEDIGEDNKATKDEMQDMDGDHDETSEVTEEDEHDKSTDKNSVEAFGEKHNNADSDILETTIMEDSPDVIQVQFKGTFLENSEEIHTNLKKFFEVEVKEVASNDAYVHSTLEDLDNEKVILIEEVKGDREV